MALWLDGIDITRAHHDPQRGHHHEGWAPLRRPKEFPLNPRLAAFPKHQPPADEKARHLPTLAARMRHVGRPEAA